MHLSIVAHNTSVTQPTRYMQTAGQGESYTDRTSPLCRHDIEQRVATTAEELLLWLFVRLVVKQTALLTAKGCHLIN